MRPQAIRHTGPRQQGSQASSGPGATPGGPGGRPSGRTFSRAPRALGPALSCRAPGGRPRVAPAGHPTGSSTLRALGFRAADASAVAAASEARRPRCHGSRTRTGESASEGGEKGGICSGLPKGGSRDRPTRRVAERSGSHETPSISPSGAAPTLSVRAVEGEPGAALTPRASQGSTRRPTGSHPSSALVGRAGAGPPAGWPPAAVRGH